MAKIQKKVLITINQGITTTDAIQKVQFLFFAYPEKEFGLNELVEFLKISKTTANKVVNTLVKNNFLSIQQLGNMWRISLNQSHPWNLTRKVPYHLQQICESGLIDEILKKYPQARSVTLFGSYHKGDDISTSDLDIAVEVLDDVDLETVNFGIIKKLGYRSNVPVNLQIFNRKTININLFTNIANGIVLHGLLEVKP